MLYNWNYQNDFSISSIVQNKNVVRVVKYNFKGLFSEEDNYSLIQMLHKMNKSLKQRYYYHHAVPAQPS